MPQHIVNRYRDLNLSFIANPIRKDISILIDADAVKQSIKNLVLTKHYERPFHPEIGCNVTALLFENATSIVAANIQRSVQDVIQNFEDKRVQLQSVIVNVDLDRNGYNVTIIFYILNITEQQTVDFFLERVR